MAAHVLVNAYVSIGGVDLSDHVRQVTINRSADAQDVTAMAASGTPTRSRLGGLADWTVEVEFNQDYASGKVDATLDPLIDTSVALDIRAPTSTTGSTNPKWTGNGILTAYSPVGGQVGGAHVTKATFVANGALTRATV